MKLPPLAALHRIDHRVNFMIALDEWTEFKRVCKKLKTRPSTEIRSLLRMWMKEYDK